MTQHKPDNAKTLNKLGLNESTPDQVKEPNSTQSSEIVNEINADALQNAAIKFCLKN